VRVKAGPLCGLTGKLVRRKENYRIVISIESINRSILCEVSVEDVEAVGSASSHGEKIPQSQPPHFHGLRGRPSTGDFGG
jgi:hypothetical protein